MPQVWRCRECISSVAEIAFGGGPDPTIAWLAGLVTGPDGTCEAAIQLPDQPGAWRLTARAADASAAVLVGEVRTVLRAARELDLHLQAPALVHAGDRIDLPVELANHGAVLVEAALRCAGAERTVTVPARGRRLVPVPWLVPEPPADAPVRRLGDRLGRVIRLSASAAAGALATQAETEVLVEPDGLPRHRRLQLVADADGRLTLPEPVPAGSLAHLEVRAWPDIGARRDEELRLWQAGLGARGAMAWLLAPAGAERRRELARRWEKLGQEPADQAVRIAALRLGTGVTGITALPEGALGEWLQARARLAGAGLPAPRCRGVAEATLLGRVARSGIALAEGWGEGQRLWLTVRPEALQAEDDLVLALALDAAVLAGDGEAQRLLAARLVSVPWADELAAVLAVELLPSAGPARPVALTLGGEELATTAGSVWGGLLRAPLDLRATPGAVVAIDLRWVAPVPVERVAGTELEVRVDRGAGFRLLLPDETVQPGERILLTRGGNTGVARLVLASGLRPLAGREATVSDQYG